MRRLHFDTLRPICPLCKAAQIGEHILCLAHVAREQNGHVLEGAVHCPNPNCLREYPIIDGVLMLVPNIRQYISDHLLAIYGRRDLSDFVESMVGDCTGPGSAFDQTRQYLSAYTWDHYADLDPKESSEEPRPASMLRCLEAVTGSAGIRACEPANKQAPASSPASSGAARQLADGDGGALRPVIDLGCSVGRGSFALADRGAGLVLGVDMNFAKLRLAAEVLRTGKVRYPRRRAGLVYERREFPVQFVNQEKVDFWACDATALPFPEGTFTLAIGMNVLDCVSAPREMLLSLGRVLKPGGKAVLTCPYDWSQAATPVETWLGGHSQRSPMQGSPEAVLRSLLTPGAHPSSVNTLKLVAEQEKIPWHVRLHDRSTMSYQTHLIVVERV